MLVIDVHCCSKLVCRHVGSTWGISQIRVTSTAVDILGPSSRVCEPRWVSLRAFPLQVFGLLYLMLFLLTMLTDLIYAVSSF